jgi:hypothetical protein
MDVTSCLDELGLYAKLCPLRRLIGDVVGVRERPSYPGGVSLETKHHRKQNKVSQRNPRLPPALITSLSARLAVGPKFLGKIFPIGNRLKQEQNSGIIFPTSGLGEKSPREKAGNPPGFE